jgi:thymidylate synthase (FAD)
MIEYKTPVVILLHATPLYIAEIAGRSCYNSFGLSENTCVREFPSTLEVPQYDVTSSELVDKLVNVHFHESVVEHINLSFYIKDVSREIIIELNRHRIGIATSQMSTRYTIESLVNAFIDLYESITPIQDSEFYRIVKHSVVHNDEGMLNNTAEYLYKMLVNYHLEKPLTKGLTGGAKKKQNDYVKRMLPESWMMSGVWTFNLRALQHLFELRLSGAAYPYIRELTQLIAEATPHKYRVVIDKKYRTAILKEKND